jgi:hypothetical protein
MFVEYILEGFKERESLAWGCQATKKRPQVEASEEELLSLSP